MSTGSRNAPGNFRVLRANYVAAKALPDPEVAWENRDVCDELADMIHKFAAHAVITRVGYVDRNSNARLYRTNPQAYAVAQSLSATTAPCGHTGVRNIGGGDFSCGSDHCDARFGRQTAEEILK